jgi:formate dehydrogenase alpha subunit
MSEVTVRINDGEFLGTKGQTILDLALTNGIEIPNLCHDPRLVPTGSCRLCLVEVDGQKGPVPSCTFEIGPEMVVRTETEELRALRKTMLELLFCEHRGVCTTCNENGECALQNYAYEYQITSVRFRTMRMSTR